MLRVPNYIVAEARRLGFVGDDDSVAALVRHLATHSARFTHSELNRRYEAFGFLVLDEEVVAIARVDEFGS